MRHSSIELCPSKIGRMFDKYGKKLASEQNDGRKDKTLCSTNITENTLKG